VNKTAHETRVQTFCTACAKYFPTSRVAHCGKAALPVQYEPKLECEMMTSNFIKICSAVVTTRRATDVKDLTGALLLIYYLTELQMSGTTARHNTHETKVN
jgi:hypothetical protein